MTCQIKNKHINKMKNIQIHAYTRKSYHRSLVQVVRILIIKIKDTRKLV